MANRSKYWLLTMLMVVAGASLFMLSFKPRVSYNDFKELYASSEYSGQFKRSIGRYEVKLKYRPSEYHFAKMSSGDETLKDSLLNANDSVVFFDLKLSADGPNSPLFEGDQALLEDRLMYFLSHLRADLWLSDSKAEYRLLNHHLERNYNITHSINVQLAFQKPRDAKYKFTFNDRMLNIGTVNFMVDQKAIDKELPHLKM